MQPAAGLWRRSAKTIDPEIFPAILEKFMTGGESMSGTQRKALTEHRRRRRDDGIVRVEVQVPAIDAGILRGLAAILRGNPDAARAMRDRLRSVVTEPGAASVFEIFGSELPDSSFEGVFKRREQDDLPRDAEL
jgi:hypothetical protein